MPYLDNADSPPQLDIPHFVDGGGYTTEFILLGRGAASSPSDMRLNFYAQSGQPIPLTLR